MSKSESKGNVPEQDEKIVSKEADEIIDENNNEIADEEKDASAEDIVEEADDLADESIEEADTSADKDVEDDPADGIIEKEDDPDAKEPVSVTAKPAVDEKTKKENEEFRKLPFMEKCKKDPMIPVSILLAFLAVLVAGIYFMLPGATTKSMGISYEEFMTRFNQSEVLVSLLRNGGLDIGLNPVPYVNRSETPSILGENEEYKVSSSYADFFAGPARLFANAGVEGAERKSDGKLAYLRIYVPYDEDINPVWMFTANALEALFPDIEHVDAMTIGLNMFGEYNGEGKYSTKGDYAFRFIPTRYNDETYIVIEFVPKAAVKASQLGTNFDNGVMATDSSESAEVSVSETVTEST